MVRAIFLQAIGDYTRIRRVIPWLMLAAFGAFGAYMWAAFGKGSTGVDRYSMVSYMLVFRIAGLSAVFFATANVSAEVEQRTIVYLLTRPVPRWMLLVTRYLAAVTVVSAIGVIASLAVSAAAYGGNPFGNPLLGKDVLALILAAFAYGGAFVLVTVVFPTRAMIICLLYVFGWEGLVPNMPGTMYYLSIFSHLQAVAQHPVTADANPLISFLASMTGTNTLSEAVSVPVLILIPIVTVGAAAWWFTHFEFLPRDDD
ncbi:MAG: ABC transporter permease [Fimbriimonadaceae bacterium]